MENNRLADLAQPTKLGRVHTPIHHFDFIDKLGEAAQAHFGDRVGGVKYHLSSDQNTMAGTLRISKPGDYERDMTIGFINNNSKRKAVTLVAGSNVFVCTNLVISGEEVALRRRHTNRFNLGEEFYHAMAALDQRFTAMDEQILNWKNLELTGQQIKTALYDAVTQKGLPAKYLKKIDHNLAQALPEFNSNGSTGWDLHNAATRVFREDPLNLSMRNSQIMSSVVNELVTV